MMEISVARLMDLSSTRRPLRAAQRKLRFTERTGKYLPECWEITAMIERTGRFGVGVPSALIASLPDEDFASAFLAECRQHPNDDQHH
jgi:hypothetical protein